jgi:hypothetical protein
MSYVDPVTNVAVLKDVDLRTHLRALIQSRLPLEKLPTFLHETAHHWCFMSPVGNALALLRMKIYRLRIRAESNPTDLLELQSHLHRYDLVQALLRPFAEGLACFAEFDSMSGGSNAITPPLAGGLWFFCRNVDVPSRSTPQPLTVEQQMQDTLQTLLHHTRIGDAEIRELWMERRMNVLGDAFGSENGYLAGYLTIKGFWHMASLSFASLDRALFLSHLKSYIYDDYAFVGMILDADISMDEIGRYVGCRLDRYESLQFQDCFPNYEASISAPCNKTPDFDGEQRHFAPQFGGLNVATEAANEGLELLLGLFEEVDSDPPLNHEEEQLTVAFQGIQRRRELLCIGSLDAQVEVDAGGKCHVKPLVGGLASEDAQFTALSGVKPDMADGAVEFYMLPSYFGRAILVSRDRECVACKTDLQLSGDYGNRLTQECGHRTKDLEQITRQEERLASFLNSRNVNYSYGNGFGINKDAIVETYLDTASFFVDGKEKKRLREEGLIGVINRNGMTLRCLALLGLANSVGIHNETELAAIFKEMNLDLGELRNKNEERSRTGVRLLRDCCGQIFSLL